MPPHGGSVIRGTSIRLWTLSLVSFLLAGMLASNTADAQDDPAVAAFLQILLGDETAAEEALTLVERQWHAGFVPMSLELMHLGAAPARSSRLIALLEEETEQQLGYDLAAWYEWIWNRPSAPHPAYGDFKSLLYSLIDPAFRMYFSSARQTEIRLDEIRWGGVLQDGIPPLRSPRMLAADEATYLADSNIVFGLEVNGDARAYPKRILAWHEMFVDHIGDVPVAGVYCTLCGAMVLYKTEHAGVNHELGTSGFLYRSNKLMYDRATQSLWNTLWGTPVVGPLVGHGIELETLGVVTTTWGAWRKRHPQTLVLSQDTGYTRDYSEGAAYREYFATDELMFNVPVLDRRLKNKDEILGFIMGGEEFRPLALASSFLQQNSLYHDKVGQQDIVILTDDSGAHRVYETGGTMFESWDRFATAIDSDGTPWKLSEARLESDDGRIKNRLPAHRAFWFGWYSAYPNTRLIH